MTLRRHWSSVPRNYSTYQGISRKIKGGIAWYDPGTPFLTRSVPEHDSFDDQRSPSWATSSTSDRLFRFDSPKSRLCSLPAIALTISQGEIDQKNLHPYRPICTRDSYSTKLVATCMSKRIKLISKLKNAKETTDKSALRIKKLSIYSTLLHIIRNRY